MKDMLIVGRVETNLTALCMNAQTRRFAAMLNDFAL